MLNMCNKQYSICNAYNTNTAVKKQPSRLLLKVFIYNCQVTLFKSCWASMAGLKYSCSFPAHFLHMSSMVSHFGQHIFCSTGFHPQSWSCFYIFFADLLLRSWYITRDTCRVGPWLIIYLFPVPWNTTWTHGREVIIYLLLFIRLDFRLIKEHK